MNDEMQNAPETAVSLEDTILLATYAHRGQFDKAGEPYICHPLRLMLSLTSPDERAVALLHDVVEDTIVSLDDLRDAGYSEVVLQAVDALTHRDGVDYFDYVAGIKQNPTARAVKLADLRDNMDMSRIAVPTSRDEARLEKYRKALAILEA